MISKYASILGKYNWQMSISGLDFSSQLIVLPSQNLWVTFSQKTSQIELITTKKLSQIKRKKKQIIFFKKDSFKSQIKAISESEVIWVMSLFLSAQHYSLEFWAARRQTDSSMYIEISIHITELCPSLKTQSYSALLVLPCKAEVLSSVLRALSK